MDYSTLVDVKRAAKAQSDFDSLVAAERAAETALTKAQTDAKAAHATAQASADRGDGAKELEAAELSVDAAERAVRTAGRLLQAATTKRSLGAATRDREVRFSHAPAINAAAKAKVDLLTKCYDLQAQIEAASQQFTQAHESLSTLHNASGSKLRGELTGDHTAVSPMTGKLIPMGDFKARLRGCGFDGEKFAWTVE